ncbi:uncharacterized protein LOC114366506 [Ostrinia furnacalis]|uniref:uncharacterized protein LOC114366506 n=1 Tax=Ostrinia furnacalis TaxID=93504 RepID=UPI00103B2A17|nr:uncharacterized protein LOC114366506 [Ostrinia furnacalis]
MNFTFLCLVITLYLLLEIHAQFNKDVVCVKDQGKAPVCDTVPKTRRSSNLDDKVPHYDPYIPRASSILYNCSSTECVPLKLYSITQVTPPELQLKSCYSQSEAYQCETIRYNYFKNIDKLLFLSNNVRNKTFYLVDCLVYSDRGRVCHKKDDVDSHAKLVDTGTIVRPNEPNVLSQDEFLCEQGQDGEVICDLNSFIPYNDGLKLKTAIEYKDDILLKTGDYVVTLGKGCIGLWCGYSGFIKKNTRRQRYEPPGGKVFRCYYAKKQQICKELYASSRPVYNERDWLST